MPAHIFLSYSNLDLEWAKNIEGRFEKAGLSVWRDRRLINVGDNFWDVIEPAIKSVGCMVILLTRRSEKSEHVRRELEIAVASRVPVLPVLIDAHHPRELDEWWRPRLEQIQCAVAPLGNFNGIEKELVVSAENTHSGDVQSSACLI